ncbi:CoA-transferase subunit beta [Aurantimonas sp. VKM B-3413]|uniref:CoA-transferase subunit beta n=1 Tax=Aurantimonas sp. VKM B-3413 TaxID=2779401 RepID=UPI001E57BF67|nr:CoA-transferase [Aurantimonas sp. VKM B-3413]MCB8838069.1 3-oxoadipate--succinyl-CoA transferase subunit B [Aurantimonas sp. VKM B-3413]
MSRDALMAIAAAREINDGEVAFIGTGLPMVAAYLAKATHAPSVTLVFESGIIDPAPLELATGVGEYRLAYGASAIRGTRAALTLLQQGRVDLGFLGTAEIDAYGNLNSTAIGDYRRPKVRLPGSGGANDIASMAARTVVIARAGRRRFVESLNYLTTPGHLTGPGARRQAGLPGDGPVRVITDMGVLGFHPATLRMRVERLFPGFTPDQIQAEIGFRLEDPGEIVTDAAPDAETLALLRRIDPAGTYVKLQDE